MLNVLQLEYPETPNQQEKIPEKTPQNFPLSSCVTAYINYCIYNQIKTGGTRVVDFWAGTKNKHPGISSVSEKNLLLAGACNGNIANTGSTSSPNLMLSFQLFFFMLQISFSSSRKK